jgi:microcystin-dependent protein
MSRNGSGTYSIPTTAVTGTSISSADWNSNFDDLGDEMTNSLALDGQSTMTGQLKAANGTVSLPGLTFGADPDSGLYRIGANNIGVALNGAKVVDVATTGQTVTGDCDATTIKQGGNQLIPVGLGPLPYSGATAPAGWILAFGTIGNAASGATNRANADTVNLFTLWWDSFADAEAAVSSGRGASAAADYAANKTIAVLDGRGRVVAGQDDMGGTSANRLTNQTGGLDGDTLGATGGAETHTLTTAQLATHDHGAGSSHLHTITYGFTGAVAGANFNAVSSIGSGAQSANTGAEAAHTHSSAGSGTAHNNVQPTLVMNMIYKL